MTCHECWRDVADCLCTAPQWRDTKPRSGAAPLPASGQFIPKRACEGAATIDHGDMRECPHPECGVSVAWDLVDHSFFGFAAGCPLKGKS